MSGQDESLRYVSEWHVLPIITGFMPNIYQDDRSLRSLIEVESMLHQHFTDNFCFVSRAYLIFQS